MRVLPRLVPKAFECEPTAGLMPVPSENHIRAYW
jgi:hypothetical protein